MKDVIEIIAETIGKEAMDTVPTYGVAGIWVDVSFKPEKPDRYLVRRKDGKIHFEKHNGSGWAYNNNSITHWCKIQQPIINKQ